MHPGIAHIMQYFAWDHLPEHLQEVSKSFGELAQKMVDELPHNPELTAGLRKLLEAKDCAVRAKVEEPTAWVVQPIEKYAATYKSASVSFPTYAEAATARQEFIDQGFGLTNIRKGKVS